MYRVHRINQIARAVLRPPFRGLFHLLCRVRITGKENVPKSGSYLIAINHISIFEPPFILAFWPVAPEAVGAVEIWSRPGQALLARLYGGIQAHRGEYDREMLNQLIEVLRSGKPLLIAPEGGRSHTPGLRRGLPGVAYIVDKMPVPVVPVGIIGTTDDFFQRAWEFLRTRRGERPVLEMRIGKPLLPPPVEGKGAQRRENLQVNIDLIMAHIAALLPPDYRGVYAQNAAIIHPHVQPGNLNNQDEPAPQTADGNSSS